MIDTSDESCRKGREIITLITTPSEEESDSSHPHMLANFPLGEILVSGKVERASIKNRSRARFSAITRHFLLPACSIVLLLKNQPWLRVCLPTHSYTQSPFLSSSSKRTYIHNAYHHHRQPLLSFARSLAGCSLTLPASHELCLITQGFLSLYFPLSLPTR